MSKSGRSLKQKREKIYGEKLKASGTVSCYICGKHVPVMDATLEHILPKSEGGTNGYGNLDISHSNCNIKRGNTSKGDVPFIQWVRGRSVLDQSY